MASRAHVSLRSYAHTETLHAHDWHQLVLPVEGAHAVDLGHVSGTVGGDTGILIVSGLEHRFRGLGKNRFLVLDIPRDGARSQGLPEALWRPAKIAPFLPIDEGLSCFTNYMAHELGVGPLDAATEHHAVALIIHALTKRLDAEPAIVARARALIHDHYAENFTVAELAAAVGASESTLHARFRAATGHSPGDYLMDVRLDRAELLLKQSDLSIAEIALAVGLSDQSALTRSFRRRRGTTPGRLRRA
jgi:AraC-like DNA-binding protein